MRVAAAMAIVMWSAAGWPQSAIQPQFTAIGPKLDARSSPAYATSDDETALTTKGYVKIGTISASQPGKKGNAEITGRLESAILQKAAQAGGEVVLFSREGATETNEVAKTKTHRRCVNSQTVSTSTFSCNPNANCYTDIHGFQHCNGSCGSTSGTRSQCTQWENEDFTVTKKEKSVVSEGTVWRYDPNLKFFNAVEAHQVEGVKLALTQGVSVNVVDHEGFTALDRAIAENQPDLAQTLLDHGADVNAAVKADGEFTGMTPLMMAATWSQGMVGPLLMRGAQVDQTDKKGRTALAGAIQGWNVEAIKQLASHGANLNWQNERGGTYLMMAALSAHPDSMRVLLELGANKTLRDKDGKTAADFARMNMSELEKGDVFTKYPMMRSECMSVIAYASEDRDWHDAVIGSAQQWLAHSPNDPVAYYWLGRGYFYDPSNTGKSDFRKAAESYEAVIRNSATSQVAPSLVHDARLMLAESYSNAELWQQAASAHEDAVREFPSDAEILNSAAWFYATTKSAFRNPGKALDYANRAIAAAPNNPDIVDTLAESYFVNGRITDAVATEKKALALAPDRKDLQKDMEKYKQAQRARQARKTQPPRPE
jgi:tetratricopeptide (TPR) repeat protein